MSDIIMYKKGQKVKTRSGLEGIVTEDVLEKAVNVKIKVGNSIYSTPPSWLTPVTLSKIVTTTPTKHSYFFKGEKVRVTSGLYKGELGVVSMASPVNLPDVAVTLTTAKNSTVFSKQDITEARKSIIPTTASHVVYYMNKKVEFWLDGKKEQGLVNVFSGATNDKVIVKVSGLGLVTLNKSLVKEVPPYVAPKSFFKDVKNATIHEKFMAKLFKAKTHDAVVKIALEGVDITKYSIVRDDEYFAAIPKGVKQTDKLPLLIAHTDLHPNLTHPTDDNLEYSNGIFKSSTGLGADDRAGVFAINILLKKHPGKFMFLFPDKEEVGLVGSRKFAASKHFAKFNKIASMFVSIDRRREFNGTKSLATYDCNDDALNKWVAALTGRSILRGSSTDCKALSSKSTTNVPCFNLSCGYTGEHTVGETLRFKELLETIEDLDKVLLDKRAYVKNKYTTVKSYSGYSTSRSNIWSETIDVDGMTHDATDVEQLREIYQYFTGRAFSDVAKDNAIVPEIEAQDYVRLAPDMAINHVYGGEVVTADIVKEMAELVWIVNVIDAKTGKFDLTAISDDDERTCTQIPRRWLVPVTTSNPLVI